MDTGRIPSSTIGSEAICKEFNDKDTTETCIESQIYPFTGTPESLSSMFSELLLKVYKNFLQTQSFSGLEISQKTKGGTFGEMKRP